MKKLLAASLIIGLLSGLHATADFALDTVFSSHMVLQQERPIAFFGTADPGTQLKVTFSGQTVTARPDANGAWRAAFQPLKASADSLKATFTDGKRTVVLDDLLIGDVWFCSGQSNMQMPIGARFSRGWSALHCEQEVAAAHFPQIRYAFQRLVPSHMRPLPAQFGNGNGWVRTSPEVAAWFSATAYFFGRKLHQDLNIPIGLVNASWGGTLIQPWISQQGYADAKLKRELALIERFNMTPEQKRAYEDKEELRYRKELADWLPVLDKATAESRQKAATWASPELADADWKPAARFHSSNYHVLWFRKTFRVPADMTGRDLILSMSKPAQAGELFLNGTAIASWKASDPDAKKGLWLTLTTQQLKPEGNVLAIRAVYCQAPIAGDLPRGRLVADKKQTDLPGSWKAKTEFTGTAKATGGKPAPRPIYIPYKISGQQFPANLYNGMVDAWTRLPIKGVIWYQGCSNAGNPHYYALHKALIADWRARWQTPDLPFLIVQLAGYDPANRDTWRTASPTNVSGYALTRDIQREMTTLPNVGLAVTIDIGEPANIHPANKQDVGKRLALEAERIAYGMNVASRGPRFRSATPENGALRVAFDFAEGLATSDGNPPGAFAIAGKDGQFVWADARIDGQTVIVSSPKVPEPAFVRYAYAGYRGDCNLVNGAGLPACPFRSDAIDFSKLD